MNNSWGGKDWGPRPRRSPSPRPKRIAYTPISTVNGYWSSLWERVRPYVCVGLIVLVIAVGIFSFISYVVTIPNKSYEQLRDERLRQEYHDQKAQEAYEREEAIRRAVIQAEEEAKGR